MESKNIKEQIVKADKSLISARKLFGRSGSLEGFKLAKLEFEEIDKITKSPASYDKNMESLFLIGFSECLIMLGEDLQEAKELLQQYKALDAGVQEASKAAYWEARLEAILGDRESKLSEKLRHYKSSDRLLSKVVSEKPKEDKSQKEREKIRPMISSISRRLRESKEAAAYLKVEQSEYGILSLESNKFFKYQSRFNRDTDETQFERATALFKGLVNYYKNPCKAHEKGISEESVDYTLMMLRSFFEKDNIFLLRNLLLNKHDVAKTISAIETLQNGNPSDGAKQLFEERVGACFFTDMPILSETSRLAMLNYRKENEIKVSNSKIAAILNDKSEMPIDYAEALKIYSEEGLKESHKAAIFNQLCGMQKIRSAYPFQVERAYLIDYAIRKILFIEQRVGKERNLNELRTLRHKLFATFFLFMTDCMVSEQRSLYVAKNYLRDLKRMFKIEVNFYNKGSIPDQEKYKVGFFARPTEKSMNCEILHKLTVSNIVDFVRNLHELDREIVSNPKLTYKEFREKSRVITSEIKERGYEYTLEISSEIPSQAASCAIL